MAEVKIAPSILSADFGRLTQEIEAISAAGADYIHVDVMDGHFVPNLTIGPMIVEVVRAATDKVVDVHLMISNAEQFLQSYAEAGADLIGVHVEACTHLHRALEQIRSLGKKSCAVLNPATPVTALEHVLDLCDMVLVMSVNPGFGGQSFIEAALPKIETVREMANARGLTLDIEVDGGVKTSNIDRVVSAGANVIVSGSGIFKTDDYAATIAEMRSRVAAL